MFLTLLAALLVISRAAGQALAPTRSTPIQLQIADQKIELERLHIRKRELDFSIEAQSRSIEKLVPMGDVKLKMHELDEVQSAISNAEMDIEQANKNLTIQEAQRIQWELGQQTLEQERDTLRREADSRRQALNEAKSQTTRRISFSLLREAQTDEIVILIRYGKLYRLTNSPDKDDVNENDIEIRRLPTISFEPRKSAGLKVSPTVSADLIRSLQPYVPSRYHITIAVWDDSFIEFNAIRNELVQAGYSYRTMICTDSTLLTLGGKGGLVQ